MADASVRDREDWQFNDFDSVIQYNDRTLWTTPDPSKEQEAYKSFGYSVGTYHETETQGESFAVNFTGTRVALYGASGPDYGSFTVKVDGAEAGYSAWAAERTNSTKLWEASGLAAGPWHSLTVTNGNASFLIDHLQVLADVSAPGKDSKTSIFEEGSAQYTGTWGNNTNPKFSGGGSTYTNGTGASATFKFQGSVVALLGDTNSDHGLYMVQVDDQQPVTLMSATGCSLPFTTGGKCELTDPNLMYVQHYLDDSPHTLKLTNLAGNGNDQTFIDIDRFIVLTPDEYFSTTTISAGPSSTSTPTITGNGESSVSSTSTSSDSPTGAPSGAANPSAVVASLYLPAVLWAMVFR
ncbi:hypothetical protein BKA62DRAFT_681711 [Auriculariales sp. MPI-PUGE-AT-0066]|nr:hypothetical protein BKA62DRAFT_681711 [Auriculariales sp. MPI-PUGE-AT-0066]